MMSRMTLSASLHARGAQTAQVGDADFDIVVGDAFVAGHHGAVQGQHDGLDARAHGGGHLEGAAALGTVADHAGHIAHHVADGALHDRQIAAQQQGRCRSRRPWRPPWHRNGRKGGPGDA